MYAHINTTQSGIPASSMNAENMGRTKCEILPILAMNPMNQVPIQFNSAYLPRTRLTNVECSTFSDNSTRNHIVTSAFFYSKRITAYIARASYWSKRGWNFASEETWNRNFCVYFVIISKTCTPTFPIIGSSSERIS